MFEPEEILEALATILGIEDVPDFDYDDDFSRTDGYLTILEDGGFLIETAPNLPLFRQALILAHEMIHVDQIIRGDLVPIINGLHVWKGDLIFSGKINTLAEYKELPWEGEAYAREKELARSALALLKS